MADKTTGELQQELMEQPNIKAYLSKNRSCFMEEGILELLESLRVRCGLSKAEIARRSGMSEVYLHQVFSGRRSWSTTARSGRSTRLCSPRMKRPCPDPFVKRIFSSFSRLKGKKTPKHYAAR